MTMRRVLLAGAALVAVILSAMPLITGDVDIAVGQHHLDHSVLIFLGVIVGLAAVKRTTDRESPPWLWAAVITPIVAMMLMSPSLYAKVDQMPALHSLYHLLFPAFGALTAYAGQRYVWGVGWATALFFESMAVAAAFGYGVAPAVASAPHPAAVVSAAHQMGDVAHGKQVFTQFCAVCHGAGGEGGQGPSLKNESSRKDFAQAKAWIEKPAPPMPELYPMPLNEKDVKDVAAFVETLQ